MQVSQTARDAKLVFPHEKAHLFFKLYLSGPNFYYLNTKIMRSFFQGRGSVMFEKC